MPSWIVKVLATVITNVVLKLGAAAVEWLEEKLRDQEIKKEAKKGLKDVNKIKDRKERAKAKDDYLSFMRSRTDRMREPKA
jgi:hypothetical protein